MRIAITAIFGSILTTAAVAEPPSRGEDKVPPPSVTTHETAATAASPPKAGSEKPRQPTGLLDLRSPTVTGDWYGWRPFLQERGVRVNAFWNNQYQSIVKGGTDTEGSGRNSASTDVLITVDLARMGVLADADVLLHLQANWGAGVNPRTGGLFQVNDDADGSIGGHVAQFWYRHHFLNRRIALRMGYLDYQTIVDRNAYANSEDKQFMHQTLDNNPLVPLKIGMGISLTWRPTDWYTLILGTADAQAIPYKGGISRAFHEVDWYTAFAEQSIHMAPRGKRGPLPGNYRIGYFYDPGPRQQFDRRGRGETFSANHGLYASLDQMLFRESDGDEQGLGVFARLAWVEPEINKFSRFYSGGFQYQGLIPHRDQDVLGFGFSLLRSSRVFRRRVDRTVDNETVYELYYAIQAARWLVITPDVQYIDNPGAAGEHGHTIVAGIRARVSF